jgi:hypothetical protein
MVEAWLNLPTAGVFALLIAFYAAAGGAIAWLTFGRAFSARMRRLDGVVPPFFGAIAILFALLTGFLAADVADRNRQAVRAVQAEAGELRTVLMLSAAAPSDTGGIRAAWTGYLKAIVADDWPAMERGEHAASAGAAYDRLLREVVNPRIAGEAGPAVHTALLNATVHVGTARSDRLAIATDRTNDLKWAVVLLLGVMTQISLGLVHLHKRGAHVAAVATFSLSVVIALGLIALQEHPFAGDVRVAPTPLQDLLALSTGS